MVIKAVLRHAGLNTSQIYIDAFSDDGFAGRHEGVSESGGSRRRLRDVKPEQVKPEQVEPEQVAS
jgi:hypothetical protein